MIEMIVLLTLQKQAELSKCMCFMGKIMYKLISCRDELEKYGNKAGMKTQEGYPAIERGRKKDVTLHLMHYTLQ